MSSSQSLASSGGGGSSTSAFVFIESQTASSSATIDFTDLDSTYFAYKFVFSDIVPATSGSALRMRTSANNGSSYDSGSFDYAWLNNVTSDQFDTFISLSSAVSGTSTTGTAGEVLLINPSGTTFTHCEIFFNEFNSTTGRAESIFGGGFRISNAAVDAVRFYFSTGNIASGTIKLYGLTA
jgi:hypothetical protein